MIKYYSLKKELTSTKNPSTATPFGCPSPIVKLYKILSLWTMCISPKYFLPFRACSEPRTEPQWKWNCTALKLKNKVIKFVLNFFNSLYW